MAKAIWAYKMQGLADRRLIIGHFQTSEFGIRKRPYDFFASFKVYLAYS